jgi:hypothetical protein
VAPPGSGRQTLASMAEDGSERTFRENERVQAADDLPGVPEGTPGRVVMVTGLSWIRYRVAFDNGVELSLLDGRHLAPAQRRARRH